MKLKRLLVLALTIMTIVGAAIQPASAVSVGYKCSHPGNYTRFVITSGAQNGAWGFCIDPFHSAPSAKEGSASIERLPQDHPLTRVAYYYLIACGYRSQDMRAASGWDTLSNGAMTYGSSMHYVLSYARVASGYKLPTWRNKTVNLSSLKTALTNYQGFNNTTFGHLKSRYNTAVNAVGWAPENMEVYYINPAGGSNQDGLVFKWVDNGFAALKKSSTDSKVISMDGYNSFQGTTYNLYRSDLATYAGTFYIDKNGNSNVIGGLLPGNYYAIETGTNPYYKQNPNWIGPITVYSNQTTTFATSDAPSDGLARIIKKESYGGQLPRDAIFKFHLTNTKNNSIQYDITINGNAQEQAVGEARVYAGTYTVTETIVRGEHIIDDTTVKTLTVPINGTGEIEWNNWIPTANQLVVTKKPLDGGSAKDFSFKVTGELYNQGTITGNQILDAADISATMTDEDYDAPNSWDFSSTDVTALNTAAEERHPGNYNVRASGTATLKTSDSKTPTEIIEGLEPTEPGNGTISAGTLIKNDNKYYKAKSDVSYEYKFTTDDTPIYDPEATANGIVELLSNTESFEEKAATIDINASIKVSLKNVKYDDESDSYRASIGEKTAQSSTTEKYTVSYKDFEWFGAATLYIDVTTGEPFTMLKTDSRGRGFTTYNTERPGILKGITKGKYTVVEQLTPDQAIRYKNPEPKVVDMQEDEPVMFAFENEPIWFPVKLKKTSPNNKIEGWRFHLTGTTDFGEDIDIEGVTDEDGYIDFGKLYPGRYVVEETSFDKEHYINNHFLPGYDNPAIAFAITGEEDEDTPIEIEFENQPITSLFITKIDGETLEFLENAEFELYEEGEKVANFQIVRNDDNTAGINMKWSNGVITGKMVKTLDPEDQTGEDDPVIDPIDDDDDEPIDDPTGGDSGQDSDPEEEPTGDVPSGEQEIDRNMLNWTKLEHLTIGKDYQLVEIRAPKGGYIISKPIDIPNFQDNTEVIVRNYIPEIETTAQDLTTESHVAPATDSTTIRDTVTYSHLYSNGEYRLVGKLMMIDTDDLDIANPPTVPVTQNGEPVVVEKTFTASDSGNGSVSLDFENIDTREYAGKRLVVFEAAYYGNKLHAMHNDSDDENQRLYVPEISTSADRTAKSQNHKVTDTVTMKNLIVGQTYKVSGTLMDKTTGRPMQVNGQAVVSDPYTFTAAAPNEEHQIEFNFTAEDMIGKVGVVYENLLVNDTVVATHSNLQDEKQTVEWPTPSYNMYKVRNENAPKAPGTKKFGFMWDETVSYTVFIQNIGNTDLTMDVTDEFEQPNSTLVNMLVGEGIPKKSAKKAAEVLSDKTIVSAEPSEEYNATYPGLSTFIAKDSKDAEYLITFDQAKGLMLQAVMPKDATDIKDFLYINASTGEGENTDSVDEPFSTPKVTDVKNVLRSSLSEDRNCVNITIQAGETAQVVYEAKVNNGAKEYLASNEKDSDSLLDGKDCNRVEKDNEPDDKDGYVNTAKTTNVKYKDPKDTDETWQDFPDNEKEDDAQTPVQEPHIATIATGQATEMHLTMKGNTVITDTVQYSGLIKGKTYKLKAELKDKTTGTTVATAEKVVTADGKDFTIDIPFTTEGNKTYVVFEELYDKDFKVAEHKDINDADQTVYVPDVATTANLSKKTKYVSDNVAYTNLIAGKTYVVEGYLVDSNGKKVSGSDGAETFTAAEANGNVVVQLPIKTKHKTKYAKKNLVAFESLYAINDKGAKVLIAEHKDPNDAAQTIKMPKVKKASKKPATGDDSNLPLYIILNLVAVAGLGIIVKRRYN